MERVIGSENYTGKFGAREPTILMQIAGFFNYLIMSGFCDQRLV